MAGSPAAVVSAGALAGVLAFLKDDPETGFAFLMDLAAADYLKFPSPRPGRFAVSYQLYSPKLGARLCVKAYLPAENPSLPTASGLWAGADWFEREAWDMYGIRFEGHPNLKRILMYEEFEGHALRKDYPLGRMQPLVPMRDAIDYEKVRQQSRRASNPS